MRFRLSDAGPRRCGRPERFLAEAIESAIAQTYPSWELLLVEDGSTDGSPEIAKRYARD